MRRVTHTTLERTPKTRNMMDSFKTKQKLGRGIGDEHATSAGPIPTSRQLSHVLFFRPN